MSVATLKTEDTRDALNSGKLKAIGWGCGDVFHALRNTLHSFPLHRTIHNNTALHGSFSEGAQIVPPSVLDDLNHQEFVVICYSRDFRDNIHRYCERFPGLRVIDWNDPGLADPERPGQLAKALTYARDQGMLTMREGRRISGAAAHVSQRPAAYGGMQEEISRGYDFVADFQRDRYRALTRHVHFMYFESIPGDIAEFGTAYGATATFIAAAMCDAMVLRPARRTLHLFDSFQGLPEITHPLDIKGGWQTGAYKDKTAAQLVNLCREFIHEDQIRVYEGWYKDTLASIPAGTKYALVHIDCDTYESTSQVLTYLFANDHVGNGCAFLFDDWNCGHISPKLGERKAWAEACERFKLSYTDCGDYSVFGHKMIVHI